MWSFPSSRFTLACDRRGKEDGRQAVSVHVPGAKQHIVHAADQERLLFHPWLLQNGREVLDRLLEDVLRGDVDLGDDEEHRDLKAGRA